MPAVSKDLPGFVPDSSGFIPDAPSTNLPGFKPDSEAEGDRVEAEARKQLFPVPTLASLAKVAGVTPYLKAGAEKVAPYAQSALALAAQHPHLTNLGLAGAAGVATAATGGLAALPYAALETGAQFGALETANKAGELAERALGPNHPKLGFTANLIGNLLTYGGAQKVLRMAGLAAWLKMLKVDPSTASEVAKSVETWGQRPNQPIPLRPEQVIEAPPNEATKPVIPLPSEPVPTIGEAPLPPESIATPEPPLAPKPFTDRIRSAILPIKNLLSLGKADPLASTMRSVWRERTGEMERQLALSEHAVSDGVDWFDKNSDTAWNQLSGEARLAADKRIWFVERAQRGLPQPSAELQALDDLGKSIVNPIRDRLIELGRQTKKPILKHFYRHYWAQNWKQPEAAQAFWDNNEKRLLRASFLKQRVFQYEPEGVRAGLTPLEPNPMKMQLLRARQMLEFERDVKVMRDLKEAGHSRFFRNEASGRAQGYLPIPGKASEVFFRVPRPGVEGKSLRAKSGTWMIPAPMAQSMHNFLSLGLEQSLRGTGLNPTRNAAAGFFSYLKMLSDFDVRMKLGFSGFHYGVTTANAAVIDLANAFENVRGGKFAAAGERAFRATTGVGSAAKYLRDGMKLGREYFSPEGLEGSMGPWVKRYTSANIARGISRDLGGAAAQKLSEALNERQMFKAALLRPFTYLEKAAQIQAKPLFEFFVPAVKRGAWLDTMQVEMGKLSKKLGRRLTLQEETKLAQDVGDHIDNIFGLLNYDNINMSKWIKDLMFVVGQAPGWYIGEARALGLPLAGAVTGGFLDPQDRQTGGAVGAGVGTAVSLAREGFTPRNRYAAALPLGIGLFGSLYSLAHTGEFPKLAHKGDGGIDVRQSWFNFMHPPTGETGPDGRPSTITLPSYMKDVEGASLSMSSLLSGKINPLLRSIIEVWPENGTWNGTQITTPEMSPRQKIVAGAKHIAGAAEPIVVQQIAQEKAASGEPTSKLRAAETFFGLTKTSGRLGRTPFEAYISEARTPGRGQLTPEQAEVRDLKRELSDKVTSKQTIDYMDYQKRGLPLPNALKTVERAMKLKNPLFKYQMMLSGLPLNKKIYAAGLASEEEKKYVVLAIFASLKGDWMSKIPEAQRAQVMKDLQHLAIEATKPSSLPSRTTP